MIRFQVPGIPQGKGRVKFARRGQYVSTYTPEKTVAYESLIGMKADDAMAGREHLDGPLYLLVTATFPIPPSWSAKRKNEARWHTSKPDADNIAKAVGDGCNGIVWKDDSRVALCKVVKVYGAMPGLDVMIEPLP